MISGVINVYKEKGYTSHDVVARLRGILKQKKIGHTGDAGSGGRGGSSRLPGIWHKTVRYADRHGENL